MKSENEKNNCLLSINNYGTLQNNYDTITVYGIKNNYWNVMCNVYYFILNITSKQLEI